MKKIRNYRLFLIALCCAFTGSMCFVLCSTSRENLSKYGGCLNELVASSSLVPCAGLNLAEDTLRETERCILWDLACYELCYYQMYLLIQFIYRERGMAEIAFANVEQTPTLCLSKLPNYRFRPFNHES